MGVIMAKKKKAGPRYFRLGMGVDSDSTGKRWEAGDVVSDQDLPIDILVHWQSSGRVEEVSEAELVEVVEETEVEVIEDEGGDDAGEDS
jgi:hypothetical protein